MLHIEFEIVGLAFPPRVDATEDPSATLPPREETVKHNEAGNKLHDRHRSVVTPDIHLHPGVNEE
jgi:hypothetical protein